MRSAVVWFVLFGAVLALFGLAVDALEKAGVPLPAGDAIGLLLLALVGVVSMPASGFWLLFAPGVAAVRRAPHQGEQAQDGI